MKPVEVNPYGACSGCFQQKIGMRHVDFEAAWDGPRFEAAQVDSEGNETGLTIPTTIDDLVLCEECIKEAALLVDDPRDPIIEDLRARERADADRIERLERQVATLKAAVAAEPVTA